MPKYLLLHFLLLFGCAATNVSDSDEASEIIGKCFEFTEPGELIKTPGSDKVSAVNFSWSYLFVSATSQEHHRESNGGKLLRSLDVGTKLRIKSVIDYPYASAGRCWVIKADLIDIPIESEYVEIPSCWLYDEPLWVTPKSPHDLKSEPSHKLEIDTPVLAKVSCT